MMMDVENTNHILYRSVGTVPGGGNANTHLWDRHVRAGAVTLLIGETSAGKTVFLHNLGYHLACGKEFLGVAPPSRLRVLSVDFESHYDILKEHLHTIGTAENWDFFDLEDVRPGLPLLQRITKEALVKRYHVIIIDPLMEAYPVESENDNAMGSQQMLAFRRLARETNAGVIVVHNSGRPRQRGNEGGKFFGRGATSRVDRADVSINFTIDGDKGRMLHVVKSRTSNMGHRIRFRFTGDLGYELLGGSAVLETCVTTLGKDILEYVQICASMGSEEVSRRDLMDLLEIEDRTALSQSFDRALRAHKDNGTLVSSTKGFYKLPDHAAWLGKALVEFS